MNNIQLHNLLSRHPETRDHFVGVFSINTLPRYSKTGCYVINLEPNYKSGSHWVAIKISKSKHMNLYFDSYSIAPTYIGIVKFLKNSYVYNSKQVQHPLSMMCGQWCLYFILRACQGWDMRKMLKPFYSNKPLINDHILNIVVKKHFIINEKVIDRKFVKAQIVKKLREKKCADERKAVTQKKKCLNTKQKYMPIMLGMNFMTSDIL